MDGLINRPLISIDIKKEMLLLENLELPIKGNNFLGKYLRCKVGKCFELQTWKNFRVAKQYLFFTKAALQLYPLAF